MIKVVKGGFIRSVDKFELSSFKDNGWVEYQEQKAEEKVVDDAKKEKKK